MNQKFQQKIYHANENLDLMRENIFQINVGITINIYTSLKNVIYVKKVIFVILPHVVAKIENIQ